jgi:hypothetical protein
MGIVRGIRCSNGWLSGGRIDWREVCVGLEGPLRERWISGRGLRRFVCEMRVEEDGDPFGKTGRSTERASGRRLGALATMMLVMVAERASEGEL